MLKRLALLLVIAFSTFGNINVPQQEDCSIEEWKLEGGYRLTDFLDTLELAGYTGRAALAPVMLEMMSRFRSFQRAEYPICIRGIRRDIVMAMSSSISGFELFMAENSESSTIITYAQTALDDAVSALYELGFSFAVE